MIKYIEVPMVNVNEEEVAVFICSAGQETVEKGQALFNIETTKETQELYAEENGYIKIFCNDGDTVKVGTVIAAIASTEQELYDIIGEKQIGTATALEVRATEKAIILAQELGIDINKIQKEGFIKEKDVREAYGKSIGSPKSAHGPVYKFDKERVVIFGAGNGAEVVIDIMQDDYDKNIVGLVDDNLSINRNFGYPLLPVKIDDFIASYDRAFFDTVIISIGADLKSMRIRKKIFTEGQDAGLIFTNAIAKSVDIRRATIIGQGNLIGAGVYIGTKTVIGNNNSISYRTVIGHHNIIGDHNLLAPNIVTSGSVEIGNDCILPAGVLFKNRVRIGDEVILPLGYCVINDIASKTVIKEKV